MPPVDPCRRAGVAAPRGVRAGPGSGHEAIGIGGLVFGPPWSEVLAPIPLLQLDYVWGVGSVVDLELRVDTLGFANLVEAGLRARVGSFGPLTLALRMDGAFGLIVAPGGVAIALGVTPGLLVSTGGRTQLTLGLDVPVVQTSVATSGPGGGARGLGAMLRPQVGLELPAGERVYLFVRFQLYVAGAVLPATAIGLAF